jgi:hypothetical protein
MLVRVVATIDISSVPSSVYLYLSVVANDGTNVTFTRQHADITGADYTTVSISANTPFILV